MNQTARIANDIQRITVDTSVRTPYRGPHIRELMRGNLERPIWNDLNETLGATIVKFWFVP